MKYAELETRADKLADALRAAAVHRSAARFGNKAAKLRLTLKAQTVASARRAHADADAACRRAIGTADYGEARSQLVAAATTLDRAKRQQAELIAEHSRNQPPADPAVIYRQLQPAIREATDELWTLLSLCDRIVDGFTAAHASLPPGVPAHGLTSAALVRNAIRDARRSARDLASAVPK